jgi:hypothetical protein
MSGELSVKMSTWLSHVRAASEQGVTMAAYATAQGLSAAALYQAKSQLIKTGAWPRSSARRTGSQSSPRSRRNTVASRFVPVRVTDEMSCRLSHVSGWTLTCDALPSAAWLLSLVQGGVDAAA